MPSLTIARLAGIWEVPISRKGAVISREKFKRMLDEYYQLRGWDVGTGLQTKATLVELGLEDVARELGDYIT